MQKSPTETTETRCEIPDLYFWLGEEAEHVGFTPWQAVWLVAPRRQPEGADAE